MLKICPDGAAGYYVKGLRLERRVGKADAAIEPDAQKQQGEEKEETALNSRGGKRKKMAAYRQKIVCAAIGALSVMLAAGCATTNREVTVLYQPVVHDSMGTGVLYLAGAQRPVGNGNDKIQWIIGKAKNTDLSQEGDVMSPIAPIDLVMDALRQELSSAGYNISIVNSLPQEAAKGIVVRSADISVNETSGLMKEEGESRVKIAVELWKNGAVIKKLSYESNFSDFAVKDRELLLQTTLQKALQDAMAKAIPEIVAVLEH